MQLNRAQVLMRALRDFNLPKIVSDDNPVFLGLISDLFPALDVPRKRELEFEKAVKHSACDLKLQPEESFVLKVVQLDELLYVRHSVFIGKGIRILAMHEVRIRGATKKADERWGQVISNIHFLHLINQLVVLMNPVINKGKMVKRCYARPY